MTQQQTHHHHILKRLTFNFCTVYFLLFLFTSCYCSYLLRSRICTEYTQSLHKVGPVIICKSTFLVKYLSWIDLHIRVRKSTRVIKEDFHSQSQLLSTRCSACRLSASRTKSSLEQTSKFCTIVVSRLAWRRCVGQVLRCRRFKAQLWTTVYLSKTALFLVDSSRKHNRQRVSSDNSSHRNDSFNDKNNSK